MLFFPLLATVLAYYGSETQARGTIPASIFGDLSLYVDSHTNRLVDSDFRERYFHGANVVYKAPPYHPELSRFDAQYSFCDEDMELMQSMGYNSIRLSVPWAGVEPVEGFYNQTYLEIMVSIVEKAAKYGIYSVIDFHQDAWNAKYCGNGAPDWASIPDKENFPMPISAPVPVDADTKHPSRETCDNINNNNWIKYYFTSAISTAIGAVYDNKFDLRARFAAYWGKVADVFSNSTSVIGYELMNEPWAGNIYEDPSLLVPGVADRQKLQPMYDEVNEAIRKSDREHLILFQGVTWEVVVPIGERFGFDHPPGGFDYANKSVLAWHCSVLPDVTPDYQYFSWKENEMKRLKSGGYVTEVVGTDKLDLLDEYKLSWMQWDYKSFANLTWDNPGLFFTEGNACEDKSNMTECLNTDAVIQWSRTYAKAVAGVTHSFRLDARSLSAELVYTINPRCTAPSVIFVPQAWRYHEGFSVEISPSRAASWSLIGDHVIVTHSEPVLPVNITVTISPK